MENNMCDRIRERLAKSENIGENVRKQTLWMILGQIELATVTGNLNQFEASSLEERVCTLLAGAKDEPRPMSALALGNWMVEELHDLTQTTAKLYRGGKLRGRNHAARKHLEKVDKVAASFTFAGQSGGGV